MTTNIPMSEPNPYEPTDADLRLPPRGPNPIALLDTAVVAVVVGVLVWRFEGPLFGITFGLLTAAAIWAFGEIRRQRPE